MFKALFLEKADGLFHVAVREVGDDALDREEGNVLVRVSHSSLNYKDALALTDRGPVVRRFPMIPGIDGVGVVEESESTEFNVGDSVIVTGYGLGETHWGCLGARAKLKSDWLVPLPGALSPQQAMGIGTAGLTAMLCVLELQEAGVLPESGDVLVTGSTGGVGSVAILVLAALGYRVVALTGKLAEEPFLRGLGASEVMDRGLLTEPGKALQRERWAGVVDTAGSNILANALAQSRYGGCVVACGLAQGLELATSVAPFILRGVRLIGVDSVMASRERRLTAWGRLARELDLKKLDELTREVSLEDCVEVSERIMAGRVTGRTVVRVGSELFG